MNINVFAIPLSSKVLLQHPCLKKHLFAGHMVVIPFFIGYFCSTFAKNIQCFRNSSFQQRYFYSTPAKKHLFAGHTVIVPFFIGYFCSTFAKNIQWFCNSSFKQGTFTAPLPKKTFVCRSHGHYSFFHRVLLQHLCKEHSMFSQF